MFRQFGIGFNVNIGMEVNVSMTSNTGNNPVPSVPLSPANSSANQSTHSHTATASDTQSNGTDNRQSTPVPPATPNIQNSSVPLGHSASDSTTTDTTATTQPKTGTNNQNDGNATLADSSSDGSSDTEIAAIHLTLLSADKEYFWKLLNHFDTDTDAARGLW